MSKWASIMSKYDNVSLQVTLGEPVSTGQPGLKIFVLKSFSSPRKPTHHF